ncbi:MAG: hypothetical protein LBJ73_03930 [Rickettsiales bacterium]|jgi:hypothetical protein|nr:hypothetical protein [Rickettsiales bacterium]
MLNKLKSYNKASEELVLRAYDYELPVIGKFSFPEIVYMLRESFKYKLTYRRVFGENRESLGGGNIFMPSEGFCLVASYYIYQSTGADKEWTLQKNPAHWWLEHKNISGPFDVTHDQFSTPFPYYLKSAEARIGKDEGFTEMLREKAMILGKAAGLE